MKGENQLLNRNGEEWEEIFLEAFSDNFIPRAKRKDVPQVVIAGLGVLGGSGSELIKPLSKAKKIGQFYAGTYRGVPLAVICQSVGSLATEVTVRVLTRTRARTIIGVGFVGALQKDIAIGDIILPTLAYRGEGTTKYYAPEEMKAIPSPVVQTTLEKALGPKVHVHKGTVFTTGALFRENDDLTTKLSGDGVLGIECETSALFLISKLHNIDAGAILLVTDNPILRLLWSNSDVTKRLERRVSEVVKAAYETARTLAVTAPSGHGFPKNSTLQRIAYLGAPLKNRLRANIDLVYDACTYFDCVSGDIVQTD
jgi:uridine phosphorylase